MSNQDAKLEVFRKQLRESLEAGGVFHADVIVANIEGLMVTHIMKLVEDGMTIAIDPRFTS